MSSIVSIGVIGILLIGASFLLYHVSVGLNSLNAKMLTGVFDGVPIFLEFRWITLLQITVPIVLFTSVFTLLLGFAFLSIGDGVEEPKVRTLAQFCAWTYFITSFLFFTMGPLGVVFVAARLRDQKRN